MARPERSTDDGATLATGAVVRAHVVARLLGVRLLRVDATLVITPPALPGTTLAPPVMPSVQTRALPGAAVSLDGGLPEAERLLREARTQAKRAQA